MLPLILLCMFARYLFFMWVHISDVHVEYFEGLFKRINTAQEYLIAEDNIL